MPFQYEFHLNNIKINNVEMGFTTHRKLEEALDEAKVVFPFYESESPLSQLGLLKVRSGYVENYALNNETQSKTKYYLINSDVVSPATRYGQYRHELTGIEYTAKIDNYLINSLAFTRPMQTNSKAKFEIITYLNRMSTGDMYVANINVAPISVLSEYMENKAITFNQIRKTYQAQGTPNASQQTLFRRGNVYLSTNAPLLSGSSPNNINITENNCTWYFPAGEWYIDYRVDIVDFTDITVANGTYTLYRFYIKVMNNDNLTMYDLIDRVREGVSKYGGLETKYYHSLTRMFDIDPQYVDYLKSIQAPQMYLGEATVRQTLNYVLSYINALARLEHNEDGLDILTLENFNESTGTFEMEDVISSNGNQNTNQIGTRSYSPLKQVLPNDLSNPNITTPSQSSWQTTRSSAIQMTDSNFELKLPNGHALYMPTKLLFYINEIRILNNAGSSTNVVETILDYNLDLTARYINVEEWKLKEITTDFPNPLVNINMWQQDVGLRPYVLENLYWQIGDTTIKLSETFGTIFRENLITTVIKRAIYEAFMRDMGEPYITGDRMGIIYTLDYDIPNYRNLKFRVEYISLEDVGIKQDKEDISELNFYSEMRQNQDESIINGVRQSRKSYGNLQRTGNKNFSFTKYHYDLNSIYEVGMRDKNDYTITDVMCEHFNEYIIATYGLTKHHNRISQATFVDQTYRWRDNYAKTVLDRHENYTDYMMLFPIDEDIIIEEQETLFADKSNLEYVIFRTLRSGFNTVKTKATTALVRTDGMFSVSGNEESGNNRKAIMLPISSYGVKQGFAFTLEFSENQIAGDGIVQKGSNWYNQAVRYTDINGEFREIAFMILSDKVFLSSQQINYETYPLISGSDLDELFGEDLIYIDGILRPSVNQSGENPIIARKDPMTNFKLTYQAQVLSYYYGLFILGQKFFSENFIVDNNEKYTNSNENRNIYLYLYKNGQEFELFDDLIVPNGYDSRILLDVNNLIYNGIGNFNEVYFNGIDLTGVTSWAIGTENKDLFIACNEALNGFKILRRHFRPNIIEIGKENQLMLESSINAIATTNANISTYAIFNKSISINSIADSYADISFERMFSRSIGINGIATSGSNISFNTMLKTKAPTIHTVSRVSILGINTILWSVRNNDTSSSVIYSTTSATPTTSRGTVAYNQSVSLTEISLGTETVISARATSPGKLDSDIVYYYL